MIISSFKLQYAMEARIWQFSRVTDGSWKLEYDNLTVWAMELGYDNLALQATRRRLECDILVV